MEVYPHTIDLTIKVVFPLPAGLSQELFSSVYPWGSSPDSRSLSSAEPWGSSAGSTSFSPSEPASSVTSNIVKIRTDGSKNSAEQIRLLLKKQSDQGLDCLVIHLHQFQYTMHCMHS